MAVLGHSIGGWVARSYIGEVMGEDVAARRVCSLVTLGTPHNPPPQDSPVMCIYMCVCVRVCVCVCVCPRHSWCPHYLPPQDSPLICVCVCVCVCVCTYAPSLLLLPPTCRCPRTFQ